MTSNTEKKSHDGTESLDQFAFNKDGLIPAIAQQHDTGEVLMQAWMSRESIEKSLSTGSVHYWSRSRQRLWKKGESSGQTQKLVEMRLDCDGDCVLLMVEQKGVACHTGRRSCFFRAFREGKWQEIAAVETDPASLYGQSK